MKISISLPDDLVARLDRDRGLISRSAWIAAQLQTTPEPITVKDVFAEAMKSPPALSRAESFRRVTQ